MIKKQFLRQGLDILQQSFCKAVRLIVVDLGFQVLDDFRKVMHINKSSATLLNKIKLVQEQIIQNLEDLCFVFELLTGDCENRIFFFRFLQIDFIFSLFHTLIID